MAAILTNFSLICKSASERGRTTTYLTCRKVKHDQVHVITGMSIVAAALLFATFVQVAKVLPRRLQPWLFVMLAFVGVGVLRWPLFWVVGALAPWALFAAWKEKA